MGDLSEHFSRSEFECKCGCGLNTVDYELITVLEDIRSHFGKSITINSGCRCSKHNADQKGSIGSLHVSSKAADFVVKDIPADDVADYLESEYHHKYGIGRYTGRTHIDVRNRKARWDERGK